MKGIAHFISGIAVATFLPDAVRQAADGSFILALGGVFALLPDTLDFRLGRYLERHDDAIDPAPHDPQPQAIAERVAGAIRAAYDTGEPRTIVLHTTRLGADLWREYGLRFSPATNEVVVRVGPVVNTAGAALPGSEPTENVEGRATVGAPMVDTYDAEVTINAFSGPSFRFERRGDAVHVAFLPWHRCWSHSLVLAGAIGLGMGSLLGTTAGLVSGLGYTTHAMQDQLGHMGSNLSWPLTKRRAKGLGLLHSGDGAPNFVTFWLATALILFNLDRFSATPRLPTLPYLLTTLLLPILVLGASYRRRRRRATGAAVEGARQEEILAEIEEVEF